jgi:hypothetical protein
MLNIEGEYPATSLTLEKALSFEIIEIEQQKKSKEGERR